MQTEMLVNEAVAYFKMAQETPRGRKVLDLIRWHQTIPFFVDNIPIFYLDVHRGSLKVHGGAAPELDAETAFYDVSRVYTDAETLHKILEGKKDSSEAQWEDEAILLLPTGNYAQTTLLHQLFIAGRKEILTEKIREFDESE